MVPEILDYSKTLDKCNDSGKNNFYERYEGKKNKKGTMLGQELKTLLD